MATDWRDIVTTYGPAVWQTAYRLLGNHTDASDCYQETFLEALKVSKEEPITNWRGLLVRIATRRGLDALRNRYRDRRHGRSGDGADWMMVRSPDPGPSQYVEANELVVRLRTALARLPAQQAEVFCLRCIDNLSYEEIAAHVGLQPNHVGVLLHRARAQLQDLLGDQEPGLSDQESGPRNGSRLHLPES